MRLTSAASAVLLLAAPVAATAQACPEQKLASPNGPGVAVTTYRRRTEAQFLQRPAARQGQDHSSGQSR